MGVAVTVQPSVNIDPIREYLIELLRSCRIDNFIGCKNDDGSCDPQELSIAVNRQDSYIVGAINGLKIGASLPEDENNGEESSDE